MMARSSIWVGALALMVVLSACAAEPTPDGLPEVQAQATAVQPNVIVIVADDLAYSDLSVYGGEIDTPNLARLAGEGVAFSRFFTAPMCSPSRAMLMTGNAAQRTGYGTMAEFATPQQAGRPGYEGYLNARVATMAEVLGAAGYQTAMAGKWHLGAESPPHERGFQRSFTLIQGAGSHFDKSGYGYMQPEVDYLENGRPVDLPPDFYSSDFYADKIIEYWDTRDPSRPFFAYLPFTAPHWPLHAPAEDIEKYAGRYSGGYRVLREARVRGLIETGLQGADIIAPPSLDFVPDWESLSKEDQAIEAREMAVYAAMVDRMDQNIGRLLDRLEMDDALDNTIIVFTSDNGPEAIDFTTQPIFPPVTDWVSENFDNSLNSLGSAKSYPFYGAPWAEAGAGPHRYYKTYVTLGGTQVPFILSWPMGINRRGMLDAAAAMSDVAPTIYDAAGAIHPGRLTPELHVPDGVSLLPYLDGRIDSVHGDNGIGLELFGHETLIIGDWKLLRLRAPEGEGRWALYNIARDPGETQDLSAANPSRFETMQRQYADWAEGVGLIPVDEDYRMFENVAGVDDAHGDQPH